MQIIGVALVQSASCVVRHCSKRTGWPEAVLHLWQLVQYSAAALPHLVYEGYLCILLPRAKRECTRAKLSQLAAHHLMAATWPLLTSGHCAASAACHAAAGWGSGTERLHRMRLGPGIASSEPCP